MVSMRIQSGRRKVSPDAEELRWILMADAFSSYWQCCKHSDLHNVRCFE